MIYQYSNILDTLISISFGKAHLPSVDFQSAHLPLVGFAERSCRAIRLPQSRDDVPPEKLHYFASAYFAIVLFALYIGSAPIMYDTTYDVAPIMYDTTYDVRHHHQSTLNIGDYCCGCQRCYL
jgi:hypothetical protein